LTITALFPDSIGDENAGCAPPISQRSAMKRRQSTLHLFADRISDQKKRLEAQLAELQPGPEREQVLSKLRQLDTASDIDEWLSSPGSHAPK
jgi:hypothetical protein